MFSGKQEVMVVINPNRTRHGMRRISDVNMAQSKCQADTKGPLRDNPACRSTKLYTDVKNIRAQGELPTFKKQQALSSSSLIAPPQI